MRLQTLSGENLIENVSTTSYRNPDESTGVQWKTGRGSASISEPVGVQTYPGEILVCVLAKGPP